MKKTRMPRRKLDLKRTTIRQLKNDFLRRVAGGETNAPPPGTSIPMTECWPCATGAAVADNE